MARKGHGARAESLARPTDGARPKVGAARRARMRVRRFVLPQNLSLAKLTELDEDAPSRVVLLSEFISL